MSWSAPRALIPHLAAGACIMNANMLQVTAPQCRLPELIAAAGERASMRFLEFFAANIRNPHTRRAYYRATEEFLAWCASVGVPSIAAVQPVHVATWIWLGSDRAGAHRGRPGLRSPARTPEQE